MEEYESIRKQKVLSSCKFSNRGNVQVSKKTKKSVAIALSSFLAASTIISTGLTSVNAAVPNNKYIQVFKDQYKKIHDSSNGYFSPDKVPYHSIETMMCEAPDYGHETTSEAFSYYVWLEAIQGKISNDWSGYKDAWDTLEKYAIPSAEYQPNAGDYTGTSGCAGFVPGAANPEDYPTSLNLTIKTGSDPLVSQLNSAYGTDTHVGKGIYTMHWIFDVDNWYGYGNKGDGTSTVSQINTYQRGEQESCWETVVFPSWEMFKWGNTQKKTGFLDLYVTQDTYVEQWRYSVATDADARAIQAAYWATKWSKEQGSIPATVTAQNERAAKLGDYLRYTMFDKFMKPIGNATLQGPGGTGYDACHYLLSWYMCWGAPVKAQGWAWREGSSASHQGYQNPLAAYALSTVSELKPRSSKGAEDYATSLTRQLEMLRYLQSSEGAIAGGVNNSITDKYDPYPSGISTFYGMAYDWQPVWHDPPSNRWFGFQAWGLQRLAEYYYESGNKDAETILKKWVKWAISNTKLSDGDFEIPSDLTWTGQPDKWDKANKDSTTLNSGLHVKVENYSRDLGIAASYANLLSWYAAKSGDKDAQRVAQHLLDVMSSKYVDTKGIAIEEKRGDYNRFFDTEVYIPKTWVGKNAQGADLKNGMKFIDQRPKYRKDVNYGELEKSFITAGGDKEFNITYHRFWAQVDIAAAFATYGLLFDSPLPSPSTSTNPSPSPSGSLISKCDYNNDGAVNIIDIGIIATAFNTKKGDAKYDAKYDLNSDNAVNIIDIGIVAQFFNKKV